jgi:hypothetical protein
MSRKDNFNPDSPLSELGPTSIHRVNKLPVYLIASGIAAFLLTMGMVAYDRAQLPAYPNLSVKPPVQAVEVLSMPEPPEAEGIPAVSPVAERAAVNTGVFCNGDEIFCSTATTNRPGETFQKLVAAIPQGNTGNSYRVVVSVVAESPAKE